MVLPSVREVGRAHEGSGWLWSPCFSTETSVREHLLIPLGGCVGFVALLCSSAASLGLAPSLALPSPVWSRDSQEDGAAQAAALRLGRLGVLG